MHLTTTETSGHAYTRCVVRSRVTTLLYSASELGNASCMPNLNLLAQSVMDIARGFQKYGPDAR